MSLSQFLKRPVIPLLVSALLMVAAAAVAFCVGPAERPAPAWKLPLGGLNGTGIGYCVSADGSDLLVNVPYHILNPVLREKENQRRAQQEKWQNKKPGELERLSLEPHAIEAEYRESVQNAFKLAARFSGDAQLIAQSEVPLLFPELGDIQPDGAKRPVAQCQKSSCWGKPPGSGCVPTGCSATCNDCVHIKAIAPSGAGPVEGPVAPPGPHGGIQP